MTCGLASTRIHGRLACDVQVGDLEASYKMEPSSTGVSVTNVQHRVGWAAEVSKYRDWSLGLSQRLLLRNCEGAHWQVMT